MEILVKVIEKVLQKPKLSPYSDFFAINLNGFYDRIPHTGSVVAS